MVDKEQLNIIKYKESVQSILMGNSLKSCQKVALGSGNLFLFEGIILFITIYKQ